MVMLAALYAKGVQINWSQFFFNELLQDRTSAQEEGTPFHYACLIILISFVVWFEPIYYQLVELPVLCRIVRYHNLWLSPDKGRELSRNT